MSNSIPAPQAEDSPRSLHDLLLHIHHARFTALKTFASVVLAALIIAALLPPSYRATAILAVLPAPEYTVRPEAGSQPLNNTALALDQAMEAETQILQSDDLHAAVLRRLDIAIVYPDLAPSYRHGLARRAFGTLLHAVLSPWLPAVTDPDGARIARALRRFSAHLTILPSKDANVITAMFTHETPAVAAQVLDALFAAYAARRSALYQDPQLETVRTETARRQAAVAAAEDALETFKRSHGISDAPTQRELLLRRLSQTEQTEADASATAGEAQARLASLSARLKAEPTNVGLYQEQDPDTRVQTLLASVQDLRGRLAAASGRYLETSRLVRDLKAQIGAREAELRQLAKDPAASVVRTGRNPAIDQLRLDRAHAAADVDAAVARRDAMAGEALRIGQALAALDANGLALGALQRRVTLETDSAATENAVLAGRELTEAEDALRLANVRVIQPGRVPQRPEALPLLVIGAGVLLGIAVTAGRVLADFTLRPLVWTADGLTAATGLDVLAVFPRMDPGAGAWAERLVSS